MTVVLDRGSGVPLHRQLYEELREAVLAGRLRSGTRLPSTKPLASELAVSRNTVMGASLQLLAANLATKSGTHGRINIVRRKRR